MTTDLLILGKLRVETAELACRLWRERSPLYWLAHELHLAFYWAGKSNERRWSLYEHEIKSQVSGDRFE